MEFVHATFAAALLLPLACAAAVDTVVNVTLPYGTVQGLATATGVSYYDIPFALPPTGDRRWRKPVPWAGNFHNGVLDGTRSRDIMCPQFGSKGLVGTEDCLTLNVFAPANATGSALLPVLFWIHGGAWQGDSATNGLTDGRLLATTTGSVVVSVHYRLGPLGFLALDELLREAGDTGNYGTHDQIEALRWVRAHIAAFGGDKDRVAVFGESACGGSTLVLMSLPSTRGLFRAAISESAPGVNLWLPHQTATGRRIASQLGCNDSAALLSCLRNSSLEDVMQYGGHLFGSWAPAIDGALLNGTIESRLASGDFNRVPLIVGTNANDGGCFTANRFKSPVPRSAFPEALSKVLPRSVSSSPALAARARALYSAVDDADNRQVLFDLANDQMFACAARRFARTASRWVEAYGYVWHGVAPCNGNRLVSCHADEIDYIWQNNAVCRLNATGLALGQAMGHYWASMAAHGNPNEGRMAGSPLWNTTSGDKWQALDAAGIRQIPAIRSDRCDFWDDVFDIENSPSPSPAPSPSSSSETTPSVPAESSALSSAEAMLRSSDHHDHSGSNSPAAPSSHKNGSPSDRPLPSLALLSVAAAMGLICHLPIKNQTEVAALCDLYHSLRPTVTGILWNDPCGLSDPCSAQMVGIFCSGGSVNQIDLSNTGLSGTLPASIGNLANVEVLVLKGTLSGPIPDSIGNITKLSQMDLTGNALNGTLPSSIGRLPSLYYLYLSGSQLSGTIPNTFSRSSTVIALDLSSNKLSGTIPPEVGRITSLRELELSNNIGLHGSVPNELCRQSLSSGSVCPNTGLCTNCSSGILSHCPVCCGLAMPSTASGWGTCYSSVASGTTVLLLRSCCVAAVDTVVNVTLPYGTVQGLSTATGVSYYDIPFALPPTGAHRFSGGMLDGTHSRGISCPQFGSKGLFGTEDCLTLNVFAPANATGSALLPVLFWIHGGGWVVGSATEGGTDGRLLATTTGSVVVSAHYRLGVYGFLALDELLREAGDTGNYGIHDLVEALRWVQAHIAAFGGDKDRVAVFGESAGAGNVLELLSLPVTRGLFRAAISESAPGRNMWLSSEMATSQRVASQLGCNDSATLLACLRNSSLEDVMQRGGHLFGGWRPTIGGALFNGTLESRLASGNFNRVPLLVGSNANDGGVFANMVPRPLSRSGYAGALAKQAPKSVASSPALMARVLELYPAADNADNWGALVDFITDQSFACRARRCARAAAKWVDTYIWQNNAACRLNETALRLGRVMGHYWASMAAHGNPNEGRMAGTPLWNTTSGDKWQALDAAGIREIPTIRADRCDFWDAVYEAENSPAQAPCVAGVLIINATLPYGTVQGLATTTGVSYYDIPFALPPTVPWTQQFHNGVLDGTRSRDIMCPQFGSKGLVGTEDCLTLNVFAPANATVSALLPVLFWIHGGGWVVGSASDRCTDGRLLATTTGSVVVSVHYRLGVYGFLALDELLREAGDTGNYGIHDLVEALRWVQAHIAAFGGDKDRVAVFGESSGAGSALVLLSLPRRGASSRVASQLGCNDSATLLACLRNSSLEDVMQHGGHLFGPWSSPTIDGALLNGTLESRLASGNFNRVPLLVGTNANDGSAFLRAASPVSPSTTLAEELAKLMPAVVALNATFRARVLALYPPVCQEDNRQVLYHFETDYLFACRARRFASLASEWLDAYGYVCYIWQNNAACRLNETALRLGRVMGHYWASMAAHGNPNEGRMAGSPLWNATSGDKWQALDAVGIREIPTIRADRCDFWDDSFSFTAMTIVQFRLNLVSVSLE
eukprot:m51a1_g14633 hypothetical protein (1782) ;mRNA; r:25784-37177